MTGMLPDDGDTGLRLDVVRGADSTVGHRADQREGDAESEAEHTADDQRGLNVGEDRLRRQGCRVARDDRDRRRSWRAVAFEPSIATAIARIHASARSRASIGESARSP